MTVQRPVDRAKDLINCGKFRILSLDIFDTTVWRSFPAPTDLFYALGHRLREQGLIYESASAASFAAERMEAERDARNRSGHNGEVTLGEIYACFPRGYLRRGRIEDLVDAELQLERESTHPDEEIVTLIDHSVGKGLDVAFVSDTYFSEEHLRAILPRPARYILASSQYRRCKVDGLHKELLKLSGLRPHEILHIGDNQYADVSAPARLGLTAVWRSRIPKTFHEAVNSELPPTRSERVGFFASPQGDCGLSAARAAAASVVVGEDEPFRTWGALFLGPIIGGFGRWVIERCAAEGIDLALCLMREGKILKQVLDGLGSEVSSREFFLSRYALLHASIFKGTDRELVRFLARPQASPAKDLLEPLGVASSEVGLSDDSALAPEAAYGLAQKIATDPKLRSKAIQASAEVRRRFLLYLRRTLPEVPKRIAVVDLGYSGTIQSCLQEILDHEGIDCRTHGLYFVTGSGIRKVQANGASAEGFLADNGQPLAIAHSFMRSPELVEQCLMCDLGSTIGYDPDGTPLLGTQHLPSKQLAEIAEVQRGLLDFVKEFASNPAIRKGTLAELKPFFEAILVRSLTLPTPLEISLFGSWVHDENFGSSRTRPLIAADLDPDYLQYASAHQLASLASSSAYWIFGLAHNENRITGEAVRSIFLRKTQPEAFLCPEKERKIHFFWNDGEAHRADSTYQLSSRRTAWTRFTVEVRKSNLLEVGFSLGQPGDVIRVGGVILRLNRPGEPVQVLREPLEGLQTFGLEPLRGSTAAYLVTDTAGIVAPVTGVHNFTGVVQVDLLFAHMPTEETCRS